MPWRPQEPGEVPTLGYTVLDGRVELGRRIQIAAAWNTPAMWMPLLSRQ